MHIRKFTVTNEAYGIQINGDYIESRRDFFSNRKPKEDKKNIKVDPNFINAMKGFIKTKKKVI